MIPCSDRVFLLFLYDRCEDICDNVCANLLFGFDRRKIAQCFPSSLTSIGLMLETAESISTYTRAWRPTYVYPSKFNKIEQDCHPRNTSDGSRQGSNTLIESLLIRF